MRIGVVSDVVYPWVKGGGEKRYYEVYKRLAEQHEVHWYTMRFPGMPGNDFLHDGIHVHCVCEAPGKLYYEGRRKVLPAAKFSLALIPSLLGQDFDVVDSNQFPFLHNFTLSFLKKFKKYKFVISWLEYWSKEYCANYYSSLIYGVQNAVLGMADKIISISSTTTQKLLEQGVSEERVQTIPLGINLHEGKGGKEDQVLFAGRLIKEKNVDLLIKALRVLKDEGFSTRLIILGDGPEKQGLQELAERLGVGDLVFFRGFVDDHEEVLGLMGSSRVFALPSEREGFGLVLLEAMSNDCICLTLDHEDNAAKEFVKEGRGLLVDKSVAGWARAIKRGLRSEGVNKEKMRNYVRERTWDEVARRVEKVLEGLE